MAPATLTGKAGRRAHRSGLSGAIRPPEPRAPHAEHVVRGAERGFTLASVVVIMAVMAIMLGVAVESVSFQARREREEELIFRGGQIVEAIRLFRARNGRFPMSLLELPDAKPRVLRKVWRDPITRVPDWVPIFFGQDGTTIGGAVPGAGGAQPGGPFAPTPTPAVPGGQPATDARGPVIGVHSRSCEDSIKILDGRTRYCEWKFVFDPQKLARRGPQPPGPGPTPPK